MRDWGWDQESSISATCPPFPSVPQIYPPFWYQYPNVPWGTVPQASEPLLTAKGVCEAYAWPCALVTEADSDTDK